MAQWAATASGSNLGSVFYNSSSWVNDSKARQGNYGGSANYVGMMIFSGMKSAVVGKTITEIKLSFKFTSNTGGSNSKTLYLYGTKTSQKTGTGSSVLGSQLGTLTGAVSGQTREYTLSSTSNAAIFNNMASYLSTGGYSGLALYAADTVVSGSSSYSTNYLSVEEATITITYNETAASPVKYRDGSTWKDCYVYYYDGEDGWRLCNVHYRDSGTWKKV